MKDQEMLHFKKINFLNFLEKIVSTDELDGDQQIKAGFKTCIREIQDKSIKLNQLNLTNLAITLQIIY